MIFGHDFGASRLFVSSGIGVAPHDVVTARNSHGEMHTFQLDYNKATHTLEIWVDNGVATGNRPFVIFTR